MPVILMLKSTAPDAMKKKYAPNGNHSIKYREEDVPEKDRAHFVSQNRDARAVIQAPTASKKPPRKKGDEEKGKVNDNA